MADMANAVWLAVRRGAALDCIKAERSRQEDLRRNGTLTFTAASPDCPDLLRLTALMEEVGEVARCFNDGNHENLRTELIQVAAVAVGWIEALL